MYCKVLYSIQYNTLQYNTLQYNTLQYIKLRYSIEAPNKYLYCTTLFCTVLYKKRRLKEENEKICPKEQTDRQRTFQKLKSTLFLYGSSPDTRGSWPINTYVLFSTQ